MYFENLDLMMVFLVFTPLVLAQVIGADVVKLHTVLGLARLTLQIKSMCVTGNFCGCHTGERRVFSVNEARFV